MHLARPTQKIQTGRRNFGLALDAGDRHLRASYGEITTSGLIKPSKVKALLFPGSTSTTSPALFVNNDGTVLWGTTGEAKAREGDAHSDGYVPNLKTLLLLNPAGSGNMPTPNDPAQQVTQEIQALHIETSHTAIASILESYLSQLKQYAIKCIASMESIDISLIHLERLSLCMPQAGSGLNLSPVRAAVSKLDFVALHIEKEIECIAAHAITSFDTTISEGDEFSIIIDKGDTVTYALYHIAWVPTAPKRLTILCRGSATFPNGSSTVDNYLEQHFLGWTEPVRALNAEALAHQAGLPKAQLLREIRTHCNQIKHRLTGANYVYSFELNGSNGKVAFELGQIGAAAVGAAFYTSATKVAEGIKEAARCPQWWYVTKRSKFTMVVGDLAESTFWMQQLKNELTAAGLAPPTTSPLVQADCVARGALMRQGMTFREMRDTPLSGFANGYRY